MKQHAEFVTKIHKITEQQTAKGWLYRFSIPLTAMEGEQQLTEWLQCGIFLKDRDPRLVDHKGEFHFTGSLQVKKAYGNYPQGLSLFGFEITPVLGKVYRVSKPKPQQTASAPQQPQASPAGATSYQGDFPVQSETVPF